MHNDMFCVADVTIVLAERKLTSYVYAVGMQLVSKSLMQYCGRLELRTVKCGMVTATSLKIILYKIC